MTMIIDLANLEESSQQFEFTLAAGEFDFDGGNVRLMNDVIASGEITKRIVQTDIAGTITSKVEIDCSRCLIPIEKDLAIGFDVSYVTADDFGEGKSLEIESDDLDTDVFSGDSLDLKEVVREQILLNLPTQLFCKEDCKGLCQKCGANRNLLDCNCEEKEIDPRWSALKNLR